MGSKTIIIDANSVGRAMHSAVKLNHGGMQTQAVFGFIKSVRQLRLEYPDWKLMVLWDGRAQWRFDLLPEYKGNRTDDPKKVADKEAYQAQVPYIQRALSALGVRQLTGLDHEADDLAGYLTGQLTQKNANLEKPEHLIKLWTGDRDWIQLVRPGVEWQDHRDKSRIVTMKNLMDETGYASPFAFLEGKVLQGDSSDCIPGVGGIGEKGAPVFLAEFGSVRNFWKKCDSGEFVPKLKAHQRLCSAEGRMLYGRNLRLMQLLKVAPPAKERVKLDLGKFNEDEFSDVCAELNFVSLVKVVPTFVQPFLEAA